MASIYSIWLLGIHTFITIWLFGIHTFITIWLFGIHTFITIWLFGIHTFITIWLLGIHTFITIWLLGIHTFITLWLIAGMSIFRFSAEFCFFFRAFLFFKNNFPLIFKSPEKNYRHRNCWVRHRGRMSKDRLFSSPSQRPYVQRQTVQ